MGFFGKNAEDDANEREVSVTVKGAVNQDGYNTAVAVFDNGDEIVLGTAAEPNAEFAEKSAASTPQ